MHCSGAMTAQHDGTDEQSVHVNGRAVTMCRPCRDAAGRLGMIDRRTGDRRREDKGAMRRLEYMVELGAFVALIAVLLYALLVYAAPA